MSTLDSMNRRAANPRPFIYRTAMLYKVETKVVALAEKSRHLRTVRTGKVDEFGKPEFAEEHEKLGWFVTFEHSHECLFLGVNKPNARVGQRATITIRFED